MMQSWHNFIYAAFDPGSSISIDKPPLAYWIQTVFSKIIGFNTYGPLLPQALCGVITVALVYSIVWRTFGAMSGLIVALVLAVTPMSVAMDRHNNADSLMVFFWAWRESPERKAAILPSAAAATTAGQQPAPERAVSGRSASAFSLRARRWRDVRPGWPAAQMESLELANQGGCVSAPNRWRRRLSGYGRWRWVEHW